MSIGDGVALAGLILTFLGLGGFLPNKWIKGISVGGAIMCFAAGVLLLLSPTLFNSGPQARIRIVDVVPVPMSKSTSHFPAINLYYDNAGTGVARGIVTYFGVAFGDPPTETADIAEQNSLLRWDGWESAMNAKRYDEMHPGDPQGFMSIPNTEGMLADSFRANFDKVFAGKTNLRVYVTFKYFEPSGWVGVTEDCFLFSQGFVRHYCGRNRAYVQGRH